MFETDDLPNEELDKFFTELGTLLLQDPGQGITLELKEKFIRLVRKSLIADFMLKNENIGNFDEHMAEMEEKLQNIISVIFPGDSQNV